MCNKNITQRLHKNSMLVGRLHKNSMLVGRLHKNSMLVGIFILSFFSLADASDSQTITLHSTEVIPSSKGKCNSFLCLCNSLTLVIVVDNKNFLKYTYFNSS